MKFALALLTLTLLACAGGVDTRTEVAPSLLWGNYAGTFTYEFYDEDGTLIEEQSGDATCKVSQDGKYDIDWSISFSDNLYGSHELKGKKLMKNGPSSGDYGPLNPGIEFGSHESTFFLRGNNLEISSTGKSVFSEKRWYATFQLKTKIPPK